jgi:hypothetical protein
VRWLDLGRPSCQNSAKQRPKQTVRETAYRYENCFFQDLHSGPAYTPYRPVYGDTCLETPHVIGSMELLNTLVRSDYWITSSEGQGVRECPYLVLAPSLAVIERRTVICYLGFSSQWLYKSFRCLTNYKQKSFLSSFSWFESLHPTTLHKRVWDA